jgi:hypothetical protein
LLLQRSTSILNDSHRLAKLLSCCKRRWQHPGEDLSLNNTSLTHQDFENNSLFIEMTVNEFYINYTISLYKTFNGDLVLPVILGAVAHHTISNIAKICDYDKFKVREYMKEKNQSLLLPCNAFSISEYTGIPRETVRRKIAKLIKLGWLWKNEKSEVFLDPSIQDVFNELSFDFARNVVEVAGIVMKRLAESGK